MKGLGTRRSPPWARLGCRLLFFLFLVFVCRIVSLNHTALGAALLQMKKTISRIRVLFNREPMHSAAFNHGGFHSAGIF